MALEKYNDNYTSAQLLVLNNIISAGVIIKERDTSVFKLGDGSTHYVDLPIIAFTSDISNVTTALAGTAATGRYTLAIKPSINDTLVFNGVTFTFVTSSGSAVQITIGATLATAIANALTMLNASVNAAITPATYSSSGAGIIDITYDTKGSLGNAYTLGTATGSNVTRSAATLTGGAGGTGSVVTIEQAEASSGIVPVADGTYTVGLGVGSNGIIIVAKGLITSITQAS